MTVHHQTGVLGGVPTTACGFGTTQRDHLTRKREEITCKDCLAGRKQVQILARAFPDQPELERLRAENNRLRVVQAAVREVRGKLFLLSKVGCKSADIAELIEELDAAMAHGRDPKEAHDQS